MWMMDVPVILIRAELSEENEVEADVGALGGKLINTYGEHLYVADVNRWYWDFKDLTSRTWMRTCDVPHDQKGSFVLKGMTNSRKHKWRTHMFAEDRADISRVLGNQIGRAH